MLRLLCYSKVFWVSALHCRVILVCEYVFSTEEASDYHPSCLDFCVEPLKCLVVSEAQSVIYIAKLMAYWWTRLFADRWRLQNEYQRCVLGERIASDCSCRLPIPNAINFGGTSSKSAIYSSYLAETQLFLGIWKEILDIFFRVSCLSTQTKNIATISSQSITILSNCIQ